MLAIYFILKRLCVHKMCILNYVVNVHDSVDNIHNFVVLFLAMSTIFFYSRSCYIIYMKFLCIVYVNFTWILCKYNTKAMRNTKFL